MQRPDYGNKSASTPNAMQSPSKTTVETNGAAGDRIKRVAAQNVQATVRKCEPFVKG